MERRPARVLPFDFGPSADPHDRLADAPEIEWLEPFPDTGLAVGGGLLGPDARYEQRESIELAFTAALQHLPARQRAVLILRDVLGFSAKETAEVLETTSVSVDSALQRTHRTIDERLPSRSQQETLRTLGDAKVRAIVDRFAEAWEAHDVDALVGMLADDARMTMPPQPTWFQGHADIATFLRRSPLAPTNNFRLFPITANAQPALAAYIYDADTNAFEAESMVVLTLRDDRIEEFTAFRTPALFAQFGLPQGRPVEPAETADDATPSDEEDPS
jgi:RNA polymerase sigma-70 factor (ECF subfamily)